MTDKIYKYSTECAIDVYLDKYQILQQTDLKYFSSVQNVFTQHNPCNIYFILRRPRLSLIPNTFIKGQNCYEMGYNIHVKDSRVPRKLRIPITEPVWHAYLKTEYPYNDFEIIINNQFSDYYRLNAILDKIQFSNPVAEPLLDYEVLYIGQAYGEDGNRTAIDRLDAHSKLQFIYSEALRRNPDSEIWLMLSSFKQKSIAITNGQISTPIINVKEDLNRFNRFIDKDYLKFSERQQVNYTEAALIRCFMPEYNKEYKDTFPNKTHSSYSDCYKFDINAIVIETDTSAMGRWLYSPMRQRRIENLEMFNYWQNETFYFVTEDDRYKLFNNVYL